MDESCAVRPVVGLPKAFASLIRNGGNFNSAGPETAEIFAALSSSLSKQLRETTAEEAL